MRACQRPAAPAAQIRSPAEDFRRADPLRPRISNLRGPRRSLIRWGSMPGLPKVPAAEKIDVDENGRITGLF